MLRIGELFTVAHQQGTVYAKIDTDACRVLESPFSNTIGHVYESVSPAVPVNEYVDLRWAVLRARGELV